MSNVPSWIENYKSLCTKYGGGLSLMGLNGVEIGVYIYLFFQLVVDKERAAPVSGIVDLVKPILTHLPEGYRTNFTHNTVSNAVKRLVSLGMVEEVSVKKAPKSAGRPPAKAFRAVTLGVTRTTIAESIDNHKETILKSLEPFEQIEENRSMADDRLPEVEQM